ncbi:MAG: quinone-dependent dihydroorotate dehydrogenase [Candidatus Woesebacteria bacterium]|nr:MAG: quinone-dependent dihydroorotate dehydrogenase [Candidatus Woesebacteria bacterium]
MKNFVDFIQFSYKNFVRKIFFAFDSEAIHEFMLDNGEFVGKVTPLKFIFNYKDKSLNQEIAGIKFASPIGLSAGFDYKAKLPNALPLLGFGFGSLGTITNKAYEGNPLPRLGRLVKTKSLMVNKGFKNEGIDKILKKVKNQKFSIPIGLSIGKTNESKMNQKEGMVDIVSAFKKAEKSKTNFSYYELNISCPNLLGGVEFYSPKKLNDLLKAVIALKLKKPLFVKMPISKTNKEIDEMLKVITKFKVGAVIFGNLQKDRSDKSFVKSELAKFPIGNFSGIPTQKRSNELIHFAYKKYGKKIKIIGCGGVFNANDAYKKIKLGASLIQLITGLVFEGPFLPAKINFDLKNLLEKDGYKSLQDAVGSFNK